MCYDKFRRTHKDLLLRCTLEWHHGIVLYCLTMICLLRYRHATILSEYLYVPECELRNAPIHYRLNSHLGKWFRRLELLLSKITGVSSEIPWWIRKDTPGIGSDLLVTVFPYPRCAKQQRHERSEERRVGKECRSRWGPCDGKE